MPRHFDQIACHVQGVAHPADVDQVPREPLVVVREVEDLIGQQPGAHHVRVIDAGRRLLLPDGV